VPLNGLGFVAAVAGVKLAVPTAARTREAAMA
jgi:hypothetical protein